MRITEKIFKEIVEKNLNGKDLSDLAKEYGTTWHNLYNHFKRRNINYVKGLHRNLKYRNLKNEDYFEEINTPTKAYILGFMMADGWVRTNRNEIGLKLQKSDKHIIELVKKELLINNKITEDKNSFGITFCSSKIKEDLIKLGLVPNKSYYEIKLPDIKYISSFIVGYLDGDGYISITKGKEIVQIGITSASKTILEEISIYLKNFKIKSKIYCDKRSEKSNLKDMYNLLIADNVSKLKFLNELYLKSDNHLNRKYEKALYANTVLTNRLNKC